MGSALVELWGGHGEYGFMVIWIMGSRSGVGGRPIKQSTSPPKSDNMFGFEICVFTKFRKLTNGNKLDVR